LLPINYFSFFFYFFDAPFWLVNIYSEMPVITPQIALPMLHTRLNPAGVQKIKTKKLVGWASDIDIHAVSTV